MERFTRPCCLRRPTAMQWGILAVITAASQATAQPPGGLVFTNRIGSNLAYCGLLGGPSGQSNFNTPTLTSDVISLTDPGGPTWGSSSASSQLMSTPSPSGLTISASGNAVRSPLVVFGTAATADVRDQWTFTLSTAVHFTLNVSVSATSTESVVSTSTFLFGGTSIVPDLGATPPPYSGTLTAPGTITLVTSGTLGPGVYLLSMLSRAESNANSWPFSGSFQTSINLSLQPSASAILRNAAPNPLSYTSNRPILGGTWIGTIDVGSTGHPFAQPFASSSPAMVALPGGPVLLIDFPVIEMASPLTGPLAAFGFPLPFDPALAGLAVYTQVVHFGGASGLTLSNAIDLVLGC